MTGRRKRKAASPNGMTPTHHMNLSLLVVACVVAAHVPCAACFLGILSSSSSSSRAPSRDARCQHRQSPPRQQVDGFDAPSTAGPLFLAKRKSERKGGTVPGSGFGFASSSGGGSATSSTSSNPPRTRSLASARTSGAGTKVLRKAANLFDSIRKEKGVDAVRDVYVRSPANSPTTYWFVGKIASSLVVDGADAFNDAHFQQAAVAQKRLIFEYAKRELRPQNLAGPTYSPRLELWLAPGNSEMDVVQNKVDLVRVVGSASDLPDNLDLDTMGYNPEIYVGEERVKGGLRVERDEHGRPTKPSFDVQLPNED